jgi:hypothetical protein
MEASVKYLQTVDRETGLTDSGVKPALCLRGRKFASCVINDEGTLRVTKVEIRDYDKMRLVPHRGRAYEPKACAKYFLSLTQREQIKRVATQGALELIRRVLDGEIPDEDIEFVDETLTETPPEKPAKVSKANGEGHASILATICAELKIEPTAARRKLRKKGLHAPYTDEGTIRGALK